MTTLGMICNIFSAIAFPVAIGLFLHSIVSPWMTIYRLGYIRSMWRVAKVVMILEAITTMVFIAALAGSIVAGGLTLETGENKYMGINFASLALAFFVWGVSIKFYPPILNRGGRRKGHLLEMSIKILAFYGLISNDEAKGALHTVYTEGPAYMKTKKYDDFLELDQ